MRSSASPGTARSARRSPSAWTSSRRATDIDYDGVSGPLEFDGNGEPLEVSYGLYRIGDNNRIDPSLTQYIPVSGDRRVPRGRPVEGTREGDGILTIGSVLPQTGSWRSSDHPSSPASTSRSRRSTRRAACLGKDVVGHPG